MQLTPASLRLALSAWEAVNNARFSHSGQAKGSMPSRINTNAKALSNSVHTAGALQSQGPGPGYSPRALLKYLKKSESGSNRRMSLLSLKLVR